MKRLLLTGAICAMSIGAYAGQRSCLEVKANGEGGLSATCAEMAAVDSLVLTGTVDLMSIRQTVEACILEGSSLKVLDFTGATFPEDRIPDDAFYTADPEENGILGLDAEMPPRLSLDRIIFGKYNVDYIGDRAFMNVDCPRIELSYKIRTVGENAFAYSTVRDLGENTEFAIIGKEAFLRCDGLTSFKASNGGSRMEIGDRAFYGCRNLTELILWPGVSTIGREAFGGTKVEELYLPMSVRQISLSEMASLKKVTCLPVLPPGTYADAVPVPAGAVLIIPEGTTARYAEATVWSGFTEIEEFSSLENQIDVRPEHVRFTPEEGYDIDVMSLIYSMDDGVMPVPNAYVEFCETGRTEPLVIAEAVWNELVNCLCLDIDLGGFKMETGKDYHLVIPAGVVADREGTPNAMTIYPITVNEEGMKQVTGIAFVSTIPPMDCLYDLQGRELREPVPGQPYIKGGKVLVAPMK